MSGYPTILEIAEFLEAWAPPASAQTYDNVGLQVGDPTVEISKGLIALDMTPDVLREAEAMGASLVITHHPLIFRPLREITTRSFTTNLAFQLAARGIALYSIHTNLDAASGGVSFALGRLLGLTDLEFLELTGDGAGETGLGAIGQLSEPTDLRTFLQIVSERLETPALRFVGDLDARVSRVAVCGGSGAEFVGRAVDAGADAYVTADVKYHQFFDALDANGRSLLAYVDAGHYETEAVTESLLVAELAERFPDVDWSRTRHRTSPVSTFIRSDEKGANSGAAVFD